MLDEGVEATVTFARQLEAAGCALLAVHGRYRGSPLHRRDGPAHLEQVRAIKQGLSIPVLSNGNVRNAAELLESLAFTGCDGVMSAEGALDDPALFSKAIAQRHTERARLKAEVKHAKALKAARRDQGRELSKEEIEIVNGRKETKARLKLLPELRPPPELSSAVPTPRVTDATSSFELAEQYIALVGEYPPPGGDEALTAHAIFHLRKLCRTRLAEFDLLAELSKAQSLAACAGVIERCKAYAEGTVTFKGRRRPASYWKRQQRRGKLK